MPFTDYRIDGALSLGQSLSNLGSTIAKNVEESRKRAGAQRVGEKLAAGDVNGAAQEAFSLGDLGTGIGLYKYGTDRNDAKSAADAFDKGLSLLGGPGGQGSGQSLASLGQTGSNGFGIGGLADRVINAESGGDPNARNPNSSATGAGQFITSTWEGLRQQHPELGLTPDGRNDPEQSRRAVNAYAADNGKVLTAAGIPVNNTTLYGAHFLGPQGATQFFAGFAKDPNQPVTNLVDPQSIAANKSIFLKSDGTPKAAWQVYGMLQGKVGVGGVPDAVAQQQPTAYAPQQAGAAPGGPAGLPPQITQGGTQVASLNPDAPDQPSSAAPQGAAQPPRVPGLPSSRNGGIPAYVPPAAETGVGPLGSTAPRIGFMPRLDAGSGASSAPPSQPQQLAALNPGAAAPGGGGPAMAPRPAYPPPQGAGASPAGQVAPDDENAAPAAPAATRVAQAAPGAAPSIAPPDVDTGLTPKARFYARMLAIPHLDESREPRCRRRAPCRRRSST